ncbi:MAG: preprotein translocase subunit SecG [Pedobacter sp.]|nr:MAG: preprotein translocase subunit SecG [Pedobacter sp.]
MTLLIILVIVFCIAIGLFILVQNPKGGGLATGGASSNMFGVQRTGDVLEKGTWTLMGLIVIVSLAITVIAKSGTGSTGSSKIDSHIENVPAPAPIGSNASPSAVPATPSTDTTKK